MNVYSTNNQLTILVFNHSANQYFIATFVTTYYHWYKQKIPDELTTGIFLNIPDNLYRQGSALSLALFLN